MAKNYYIVYSPPIFSLMPLYGRISHPSDLLTYLCEKDAAQLNENNYCDYLSPVARKEKKTMAETLAMECYTLTYIGNLIAKCDPLLSVILADGKRRILAQIITRQGHKPEAVFITAMSANFPSAVAAALALNHGRIPVILGGIHVSTSPADVNTYIRQCAPFPELISQVTGPADSGNIRSILADLKSSNLKDSYSGQTSLEDGIWGYSNVSAMPPLKLEHLRKTPLVGDLLVRKFRVNVTTPYIGCPFNCSFCSISTLPKGQRSFTVRDPADFVNELKAYQKGGVTAHNRFFFFLPDNLLLGGKRLEEILDRIIAERMKINFAAQISIDVANDEHLLRKLRLAGATHFFIGLESLDLRNLEYIGKHIVRDVHKKKMSVAEYYHGQLRKIQKMGISVHGSFIFGLPFDYFNSLNDHTGVEIADFCVHNHIGLQPSILTDLPGSINYRESQAAGHYLYGRQGSLDYLVALCLADLSETNRIPFDRLKKSSLLICYIAYQAIQRVGASRSAMKNAFVSMIEAAAAPTLNGLTSLWGRLEDGLFAFASQLAVGLYKDHADMVAYSHNGLKGIFERLYESESDPSLKKLLGSWVAQFRESPATPGG
ncbi:MAG: radical SAM protein [Desulfobacteraceae bacterium]|nr:radical SAM protein [Desulfobacteraceae bacterium]